RPPVEGTLGAEDRQQRLLDVPAKRAALGIHQQATDRAVALELEADPRLLLLQSSEERDRGQGLGEQSRRPRLGAGSPARRRGALGGARRDAPEVRAREQGGEELVRHPPCLTARTRVGPVRSTPWTDRTPAPPPGSSRRCRIRRARLSRVGASGW